MLVLGIDALDIDLVNDWGLRNLEQRQHGSFKVPINPRTGIPSSVQVWSSFLTGCITNLKDFEGGNRRFPWIFSMLKKLRVAIPIPIHLGLGNKISTPLSANRFPELHQSTFLDEKEIGYYNAPFYDFDHQSFDLLYGFHSGEISLEETWSRLDTLLNHRIAMIRELACEFEHMKPGFFFYMHVIDALQHLALESSQLYNSYARLNNLIGDLSTKLDQNECKLLIISDHGWDWDNLNHSDHGFYSSSFKMEKPQGIDSFRQLIMRELIVKKGKNEDQDTFARGDNYRA